MQSSVAVFRRSGLDGSGYKRRHLRFSEERIVRVGGISAMERFRHPEGMEKHIISAAFWRKMLMMLFRA